VIALIFPFLVYAQPNDAPNRDGVGDVILVIGSVQIQRGDQQLPISRGTPLMVGDIIETPSSGHVHLRFVDGALLSIRPSSVFKIVEYRFDKDNPSSSAVRFHLERGIVRAISGEAATASKDKFRLNTPLAAIGVKGTDFVVESASGHVNALVNQGAIVLAPIDGQCRADALGPCSSLAARELSAAMRGMALTYSASMAFPQLLPLIQLKGSELTNVPVSSVVDATTANSGKSLQVQSDGKVVSSVDQILKKTVSTSSLIWGRWGQAKEQDALTVSFSDAMKYGAITIGDGYYFLFRKEAGALSLLNYDQGMVNFNLQSSHAFYVDPAAQAYSAAVAGGNFGVNFSTRGFETNLQLKSPQAGDQVLQSSGKLYPDGIFVSNTGSGKVAGALSLDTRQAGYLFSLPTTTGGTYRGATTWGR